MSLIGNSHPIVTRCCRVSRAPPHSPLPASLDLNGTEIYSIEYYFRRLSKSIFVLPRRKYDM